MADVVRPVGSASRGSVPRARVRAVAAREAARAGPGLVGRGEELARLAEEMSRAAAGELRVVLLVGEAGVGKSRLARELLAGADASIGLFARAHALAATAPLGLWTEAIDPFLQERSEAEVVELCGGVLDDLASLFFSVARVRGSVPEREPPLPRLLQGLAHVLRGLSQQAPLVVVLDDAHFGDASSWESLRFLARHLDDARLLVVLTGRPADLSDHELAAQVLFELDQDGFLVRLGLAPLARGEMRQLSEAVIDAPAPAALVDWIAERSQGNPLYAIGLLRALLVEGADLSTPHLERLPEGLAERVSSELRQFDPTARSLLELLAVVARPVSLRDLGALAGEPPEALEGMVDGLVRARIVAEDERGGVLAYEVHHPLIRDVIYRATSRGRRRVLHRRAGRSLRASGHLAEAALHFARAAERGDSEAVEVLLDAMRQAERREAFREALDLQAELVELLPEDDARWLEVLEAMYARAEWLIDHRAETHAPVAIRALRAIDGLLEGSPDRARHATVKFRLANFLAWGTGELEAAQEACEQARILFSCAGEEQQALLAAREVGWIKGLRGDLVGMAQDAERVVRAGEASHDRFVVMQGLAAVGYSANFRGAFAEGEEALRRAATIAREDEKAYRLTVVLGVLAAGIAGQGRAAEAVALLDEARSANPEYRDSVLLELEALVRWIAGDFRPSMTAARDAAAWVVTPTRRRAFGMVFGGLSALEVGDVGQADRLIDRAHGVLGERQWQFFPPLLRWAEAVTDWHAGRAAECVAKLRPAVAELLGTQARKWAAYVLFDLAEAAADADDYIAATAAASDFDAVARFVALPMYRGLAATASAWASLAAGHPEQAVDAARAAIGLLAPTGCRAHLARAHYALGRALAPDARGEAVAALERSAAVLEECGGTWRRGRSLDALRRLGSAGRRAAAAALGPGSLTRREREVARLAATGMTAREIAQTLFVGERTVESHLASVYAKLGVESKLQLVRRSGELGLS
jgi:DNA-binding CsgD family transcriptional regulator/tetratricopeptide (TPR) repeat protein